MITWRRPHGLTWTMVFAGSMIGFGILLALGIGWASGGFRGTVTQQLTAVVFFAVWFAAGWRLWRTGMHHSDRGVRVDELFWSRTIPWRDVAGFDSRSAALPVGGVRTGNHAIWIRLRNGEAVEGMLLRRKGARARLVFRNETSQVLSRIQFDNALRVMRREARLHGVATTESE